jgi:hypothetical protein
MCHKFFFGGKEGGIPDSTVSVDIGIEPRTFATMALAIRSCNYSARSYPHSARYHPLSGSARSHLLSVRSHSVSTRSHPLLVSARSHLLPARSHPPSVRYHPQFHTRLDIIYTGLDFIHYRLDLITTFTKILSSVSYFDSLPLMLIVNSNPQLKLHQN